jgi:hypothetical protein
MQAATLTPKLHVVMRRACCTARPMIVAPVCAVEAAPRCGAALYCGLHRGAPPRRIRVARPGPLTLLEHLAGDIIDGDHEAARLWDLYWIPSAP